MPHFTIEATYRIPVYRQRTYEPDTLDEACRLAIEDDAWSGQKKDYESSGETYVTGAWPGADTCCCARKCDAGRAHPVVARRKDGGVTRARGRPGRV